MSMIPNPFDDPEVFCAWVAEESLARKQSVPEWIEFLESLIGTLQIELDAAEEGIDQ